MIPVPSGVRVWLASGMTDTQVQTTARYAHLANDPVKAAADRIASRIADVAG